MKINIKSITKFIAFAMMLTMFSVSTVPVRAMIIRTNTPALNSHRTLELNTRNLHNNLEKLSSTSRINRAGDDIAGISISEKMRNQLNGLTMAEKNTQNTISLISTAESGLNETHAILQRMRELALQSGNGTFAHEDRSQIEIEFQALKSEIDRIGSYTNYNGIKLLDGSLVQMGSAIINIDDVIDPDAIDRIDAAMLHVSEISGQLGTIQNQLEHTLNNLSGTKENLIAAESSVRDVDMASETMEFARNNILMMSSQAMLAQANQLPRPDDWFHRDVGFVVKNAIMPGVNDEGVFSPHEEVTCEMLMSALWSIAGFPDVEPPFSGEHGGEWSAMAVCWAERSGINVIGNHKVTRESAAAIVYRYAGEPPVSGGVHFADSGDVSDWAYSAVTWAVNQGIIIGYPDNTFRPNNVMLRAELVAMMHRFAEIS